MNMTDNMQRARELKPCPFCGGEATISWKGNIHSTRSVVVKCSGCRYERKDSALRYGDDWLLNVAVTAWNRRALSHAAAVEGYVTVPKTLTTDMLEAGEQELAMGNDFADAWEAAIDTMLGVPSFTPPPAPAAVAGGDAEEDAYVIDALAHLLAEISIIVNGPEPAGTKWSYHDLPKKVRALATHPAAAVDEAVSRAYDAGFRVAANWMERDDLHADCGSQAYAEDKAAALHAGQEVGRG